MSDQPPHVRHFVAQVAMPKPSEIRAAMRDVEGFNAKLAVLITRAVGTMACAYVFAIIALIGLPTALSPGGEGAVSWIAQTFLQLVLLSIIMVGQTVQAKASDARAIKEFTDTEVIMDRLDEKTAGGIQTILARIDALEQALASRPSS
ncbi:MAG: hypothetical protein ABSH51_25600 [Solirubrobacteraceae bacterium]|jgi:hypothetical protein